MWQLPSHWKGGTGEKDIFHDKSMGQSKGHPGPLLWGKGEGALQGGCWQDRVHLLNSHVLPQNVSPMGWSCVPNLTPGSNCLCGDGWCICAAGCYTMLPFSTAMLYFCTFSVSFHHPSASH